MFIVCQRHQLRAAFDQVNAHIYHEYAAVLEKREGLRNFFTVETGPDEALSISVWDDESEALASASELDTWLKVHAADLVPTRGDAFKGRVGICYTRPTAVECPPKIVHKAT